MQFRIQNITKSNTKCNKWTITQVSAHRCIVHLTLVGLSTKRSCAACKIKYMQKDPHTYTLQFLDSWYLNSSTRGEC